MAKRKRCRVLFIGNSYTYVNDLPSVVRSLAASHGRRVTVGRVAGPNQTLADHARDPQTTRAIASRPWDVVVLQEQSTLPALPQRATQMFPAARDLAAAIRARRAAPMFFVTPAHRRGLPQAGLYGYQAMQAAIDRGYAEAAAELHVALAPVGDAWALAARTDASMLWLTDGSHPAIAGTYLDACVFYAKIFGSSPQRSGFMAGLEPGLAARLQADAAAVAWR